MRHNGVLVNDNPYDTSADRMSIYVENLSISLHSQGTKVQFVTSSPTESELVNCCHVDLTGTYAWNPKNVSLGAIDLSVIGDPRTQP